MELYALVPKHAPKHEAPVVQLYHRPAEEVVAETIAAMMPHNDVPVVIIPVELRTAYNDKLNDYKEVSEKLNKRHKFMSVAVLELTTERFMDLIEELSSMLNEVDAIREHTLEEAMEGFAV